jgi:Restriction endonuclease
MNAPPTFDPFIDKLVDWRDFEHFVRDLYVRDPDITAEHNVTEVGRSGARRQIDVKITQGEGESTEVTLVECKRWKEKVSRDRVDVLFAGIDDLEASKGVIFTTKGYEAGAEAYAKSKDIELFIVRDLTDLEWGLPGRAVWLYLHLYAARFENLQPDAELMAIVPNPPNTLDLNLNIGPGSDRDPAHILQAAGAGAKGPNLLTLLYEARDRILRRLASQIRLMDDGAEVSRAFRVPVEIKLTDYPFREIPNAFGYLRLGRLSFELLAVVSQSRLDFDRGKGLDLALAVENYITRERDRVIRRGEATDLEVVEVAERAEDAEGEALENGTVFQVFTEPWVDVGALGTGPEALDAVSFDASDLVPPQ